MKRSCAGMRGPLAATLSGILLLAAGCTTTPPSGPDAPREVQAKALAPYAMHEECLDLARGDRLDYRFTATAAVAFNIHYHDNNAVVMPIAREAVTADSGIFQPVLPETYCLMWEAAAVPVTLDYRVAVRRRAR